MTASPVLETVTDSPRDPADVRDRTTHRVEVIVPAVPVVAAAVRDVAAVDRPAETNPQDAGAPVVRISIGRVEVRAAPPAAPPVRRERPAVVREDPLPLHDYLRGRRGAR